jgi:hypothetical protein
MLAIGTRRLRRPFVWLLIVQQVVAGAGVSLSCPAAAASSAERFPCERCGCGCQSAERCWTRCACFTFEEKVAWARKYGLAVPEYAVAAAKREAAAPQRPPCARRRCPRLSQAARRLHDVVARNGDQQGRDKDRSPRGVSWVNALRCHGLTQQWQAATANWPGDRQVGLCLVLPLRGRVEPQPFLKPFFSPSPPPTPPPNAA